MSTMVERVARAIGVADLNASAKSMPNVPMETMAEYVKHAADEGHYEAMARAAIEAMIPFIDEIPLYSLTKTSETDPKMIWAISADAHRRSIVRHLQAALKEQA